MTEDFAQTPQSDNLFVARTKAGKLVLAQRLDEEGRTRVRRLAALNEDSVRSVQRANDGQLRTQRQNFTRLARDPSELAKTARGHELIVAFNKADEPTQIRLAMKRPGLIRFLANPSPAVALAAVASDPRVIKYIKNPSEKLQIEAVSRDGLAIQHISPASRTEKVRMAAVKQNGHALYFIGNASTEVKKTAIERNPEAARHVKQLPKKRDDFGLER